MTRRSTPVAAAFEAWALCELASRYAAPCPDVVMDHLTTAEKAAFNTLLAAPAESAEDLLVKAFSVMVRELVPEADAAPLVPNVDGGAYAYDEQPFAIMLDDMRRLSTPLARAMAFSALPRSAAA